MKRDQYCETMDGIVVKSVIHRMENLEYRKKIHLYSSTILQSRLCPKDVESGVEADAARRPGYKKGG